MISENEFLIDQLMKQIKDDYQTLKYQAEVSINTLLSIFIEALLNQYLYNNRELVEKGILIGKEFRFKKISSNQSENIDFLFGTRNTLYFIELKTASSSYDAEQFYNYNKLAREIEEKQDATFLIKNYETIEGADKKSKKKYDWQFRNKIKPSIKNINRLDDIKSIKIVYIAPTKMQTRINDEERRLMYISLEELSKIKLSKEFADKNKSKMWDRLKSLFEEIDNLDLEYNS
jgi:hypothetical protein